MKHSAFKFSSTELYEKSVFDFEKIVSNPLLIKKFGANSGNVYGDKYIRSRAFDVFTKFFSNDTAAQLEAIKNKKALESYEYKALIESLVKVLTKNFYSSSLKVFCDVDMKNDNILTRLGMDLDLFDMEFKKIFGLGEVQTFVTNHGTNVESCGLRIYFKENNMIDKRSIKGCVEFSKDSGLPFFNNDTSAVINIDYNYIKCLIKTAINTVKSEAFNPNFNDSFISRISEKLSCDIFNASFEATYRYFKFTSFELMVAKMVEIFSISRLKGVENLGGKDGNKEWLSVLFGNHQPSTEPADRFFYPLDQTMLGCLFGKSCEEIYLINPNDLLDLLEVPNKEVNIFLTNLNICKNQSADMSSEYWKLKRDCCAKVDVNENMFGPSRSKMKRVCTPFAAYAAIFVILTSNKISPVLIGEMKSEIEYASNKGSTYVFKNDFGSLSKALKLILSGSNDLSLRDFTDRVCFHF